MARKFKIGDKVEVVKTWGYGLPTGFRIGSKAKVISISTGDIFPYQLKNRCWNSYFNARELKLIERKGDK